MLFLVPVPLSFVALLICGAIAVKLVPLLAVLIFDTGLIYGLAWIAGFAVVCWLLSFPVRGFVAWRERRRVAQAKQEALRADPVTVKIEIAYVEREMARLPSTERSRWENLFRRKVALLVALDENAMDRMSPDEVQRADAYGFIIESSGFRFLAGKAFSRPS